MRTLLRSVLAGLLALVAIPAGAQTTATAAADSANEFAGAVVVTADALVYDEGSDTVIASGNVEIAQGGRVLRADRLRYRRREGTVTASGGVALLEPGRAALFADEVTLTDDLRNGAVHRPSMLLADRSRVVANDAERRDGNRTVMRKAVFSPCDLCPEDDARAPLWRIRAGRAVHDEATRTMTYRSASLELFGVPIAYTPYFRYPDPTVKRASGLLAPKYRMSSALGLDVETRYFWNIAPHRDATFSPRFTSSEGIVLAGEYRERTRGGFFAIDGSITRPRTESPDGRKFRGHLFANGAFDIDPAWRWGFDLKRALDDTYLRRYDILPDDKLVSNLFAESYDGRSVLSGDGYWFQGLTTGDDDDRTPIVLPLLDANIVRALDDAGGYVTLDGNVMILERQNGTDSRRLSVTGGWNRPFVSEGGHVLRLDANLRGDLYHTAVPLDPARPLGARETRVTGRLIPEAAVEWRFPLVARIGAARQLVEPIVQGIASPRGGNSGAIPNEDSRALDFNHANLFSANRFTGFDRVEGGPRINYGVRLGFHGRDGERVDALLGQVFRLKEDRSFDSGSGLRGRLSDYVGRVSVRPLPATDLVYRFRLDRHDFSVRRNEVDLAARFDWLRGSLTYVDVGRRHAGSGTAPPANRKEIVLGGAATLPDGWTLSAGTRRNLAGDGTAIDWNVGLSYRDECVLVDTRMVRSFTRDRDVEPDTRFLFTVLLKHLG